MLSRALILATVMLLVGCLEAGPALAQVTNLEAGKSPSQIFEGSCAVCHKGARGLLKTVAPGSLPGFLRQHYTTSTDMAGALSAYLISNGATDTRYNAGAPKTGPDGKPGSKPTGTAEEERQGRKPREAGKPEAEKPVAARPAADGLPPQAEYGRRLRNGKRRPGDEPEAARSEGQAAAEGAEGRKGKQKLSKRGSKPGSEEPPKSEAKTEPKTEPGNEAKPEAAKEEASKPDTSKSDSPKSDSAKVDAPKADTPKADTPKADTPKADAPKAEPPKDSGNGQAATLRPDPVPAVTPATAAGSPATPAPAAEPASPPSAASTPAPAAVTAAAPPLPPVAPAGPPAPPISQ